MNALQGFGLLCFTTGTNIALLIDAILKGQSAIALLFLTTLDVAVAVTGWAYNELSRK